MSEKENKYSVYVLGGVIGAAIGVLAAFLIQKTEEFDGQHGKFSSQKITKTTMGIVSLLWSLIDKGKGH